MKKFCNTLVYVIWIKIFPSSRYWISFWFGSKDTISSKPASKNTRTFFIKLFWHLSLSTIPDDVEDPNIEYYAVCFEKRTKYWIIWYRIYSVQSATDIYYLCNRIYHVWLTIWSLTKMNRRKNGLVRLMICLASLTSETEMA